jgi:hypothetical protein
MLKISYNTYIYKVKDRIQETCAKVKASVLKKREQEHIHVLAVINLGQRLFFSKHIAFLSFAKGSQ